MFVYVCLCLYFRASDDAMLSVHFSTFPVSGQFSQLTLFSFWNVAGAQQPMLQQVCNPLGILHVRLPAENVLHVLLALMHFFNRYPQQAAKGSFLFVSLHYLKKIDLPMNSRRSELFGMSYSSVMSEKQRQKSSRRFAFVYSGTSRGTISRSGTA